MVATVKLNRGNLQECQKSIENPHTLDISLAPKLIGDYQFLKSAI